MANNDNGVKSIRSWNIAAIAYIAILGWVAVTVYGQAKDIGRILEATKGIDSNKKSIVGINKDISDMRIEIVRNISDMKNEMLGNFSDMKVEIIKMQNEFTNTFKDVKSFVAKAGKNEKAIKNLYASIKRISEQNQGAVLVGYKLPKSSSTSLEKLREKFPPGKGWTTIIETLKKKAKNSPEVYVMTPLLYKKPSPTKKK